MSKETENKDAEATLAADLEKAADDVFGGEGVDDVKKVEAEKSDQKAAAPGAEAKAESGDPKADATKVADADKMDPKDGDAGVAGKDAAGQTGGKKDEAKAADAEKDEDELTPEDLSTAGMKEETAKKFEKVIGNNQKLKTQLDEAREAVRQRDEVLVSFKQMVTETGLNQQQLEQTLKIGALINRNPIKAAEVLHGIAADLAKRHGVALGAVDLLDGFEDLQKKVKGAELSQEDALEIAKARRRAAAENDQRLRTEQSTKAQETAITQVNAARAEVASFLKEAEKDVNFAAIAPRLVRDAQFAAQNLAPEKWLSYIKQQHTAYMEMAAKVGSPKRDTPIVDDSGHRPDPKPQPKTLEDLADYML